MKKINFLFALALTGFCASSAHAGAWSQTNFAGGFDAYSNINRQVNGNPVSESIQDPGNSKYTTARFVFYPSGENPDETVADDTIVSAIHVFDLAGGPLAATVVGPYSYGRLTVHLSPYGDFKVESSTQPSLVLPTTVQHNNVPSGTVESKYVNGAWRPVVTVTNQCCGFRA